jgi:thioredoxin 1
MTKDQKDKTPPKPPAPEPTTDMQFNDKVVRANIPVVVFVWAPYSEECEVVEKMLEQLAVEYDQQVCFFTINADKNPETFGRYGIRSVPTLLFFHDCKIVDRIVGMIPAGPLKSRINRMLESEGEKPIIDIPGNLAQWESDPSDTDKRTSSQ